MFLLFSRWLKGEAIDAQIAWLLRHRVNVARVLGMVGWAGQAFGPSTPGFWDKLPTFIDHLAARGLRCEFVVFADAGHVLPHGQQAHLDRVHDVIGDKWNVLIEIGNEPWQNGVVPRDLWSAARPRRCPMAYGDYDPEKHQEPDGRWVARLPVLDYLTVHSPRDPDAWARKAKDLAEFRDGSGDGTEHAPLFAGLGVPCVGDEPMGAAEAHRLAGRQRSNNADDFFWYHANAHLNGGGSTFHCDAGLLAEVAPAGGDQERCFDAATLAWSLVEPEFQQGRYTRSGLGDCPLVFREEHFPEQTSRIYARVLGNRAIALAIKPTAGWRPESVDVWRIARQDGPQDSLVHLTR